MLKETNQTYFVIRDSQGRFNGHINIISNSDTGRGNYQWNYSSETSVSSWNIFKENVEIKIDKLRELNALAGYNLDWEIVEFTQQEILNMFHERHLRDQQLGLSSFLSDYYNLSLESKVIEPGCIGLHRKAVNEINKKYKLMEKRRIA